MQKVELYLKQTITYNAAVILVKHIREFVEIFGKFSYRFFQVMQYLFTFQLSRKQFFEQASRFAVDSLPITLSIVAMTAIILAMQIAPEMVKQGGKDYIGLLMALTMVREIGVIMTGFAIISMIGSSQASELATMRVTEQIDAMKVLKVSPFKYLFLPRVMAGFVMMPFIVILSTTLGIIAGGFTAMAAAKDVTWLCYITSVWQGLYIRDINIMLFKSACFGGCISLISSSCGYDAQGGAKGVGIATTKAVVLSFVAIVIVDCIFAAAFYM
ncbi:MAG: ABC transporter permease [Candidatus Gastranaerophilales bacterium]|nr:ABC transporter permease [Candidatus Gastranaerophilales bacterium]